MKVVKYTAMLSYLFLAGSHIVLATARARITHSAAVPVQIITASFSMGTAVAQQQRRVRISTHVTIRIGCHYPTARTWPFISQFSIVEDLHVTSIFAKHPRATRVDRWLKSIHWEPNFSSKQLSKHKNLTAIWQIQALNTYTAFR